VSTRSQFSSNPARLSPELQAFFPTGVVVTEMREPGDASLLLPAEADFLGRAVEKRVQEFSAGRLCARRALAEFGVVDFALRVAHDRQPIWPDFTVGSITHTTGLCVAAVAERRRFAAIGMDSEVVGQVSPDIWATLCVAGEAAWLDALPVPEQPAAVTLLFSAKEAFYKCQYPLVGEWLDFHDLRIEPLSWGSSRGGFAVHPTRPLAVAEHVAVPIQGQYLFHQGFVTAAVTLERALPEGQ
jgi:4'-phosphopantetheinyl transferase EntD